MTNISRRLKELEGLVKAKHPRLPLGKPWLEWSDAQLFRYLKDLDPERLAGVDRVEDLTDEFLAQLLAEIRHGKQAILENG